MTVEDEQQMAWNYLDLQLYIFSHYTIILMVAYLCRPKPVQAASNLFTDAGFNKQIPLTLCFFVSLLRTEIYQSKKTRKELKRAN